MIDQPATSTRTSRGLLALVLSMLTPGLGQAMAGRVRRGAGWFGVSVVGAAAGAAATRWSAAVPVAGVVSVALLPVTLGGWVDAFLVGRRAGRPRGSLAPRWAAAGVVVVAVTAGTWWFAGYARRHWGEGFVIPTPSMAPTLVPNDRIFVHKRQPWGRWNVVAFHSTTDPRTVYVKRVVGLPGETVQVIDGQILINGSPVPAPAGVGPFLANRGFPYRNGSADRPVTLGTDELFVVGDSPLSFDSRYWDRGAPGHQPAALPVDHVIGTATYLYWPPSRWRRL